MSKKQPQIPVVVIVVDSTLNESNLFHTMSELIFAPKINSKKKRLCVFGNPENFGVFWPC